MKGQAFFKQCNGFFFVKNQIVVSRKFAFTFKWLTWIWFPVEWLVSIYRRAPENTAWFYESVRPEERLSIQNSDKHKLVRCIDKIDEQINDGVWFYF